MNKDKYGIIGQIQPNGTIEGGDSVNWRGHYVYFTGNNKVNFRKTFEVKPGAYVRHPDPKQTNNGFGAYYKNAYNGCISRDQLTGIIAALIKLKDYKGLLLVMLHHAKSLFLFSYNTIHNGKNPNEIKFNLIKFFYNPKKENYYHISDFTGPEIWAMYLRGFGKLSYIAYPLLCILDLHLLVNTIITNKKENTDPISYALKFMVSRDYVPTITSKYCEKILNKKKLLSEIKQYWCGWRQNCDMYKFYEDAL